MNAEHSSEEGGEGLSEAREVMAEAPADRVTWDDGTEYINVDDAARIPCRVVHVEQPDEWCYVCRIRAALANPSAAQGEAEVPSVAIKAQNPDLDTAWQTIAWWEQTCAYWQAEARKGYALRDSPAPDTDGSGQ